MRDFSRHFTGMLRRRISFPVSATLGFIGLALAAAFKAIFDVTVQDFWKDTANPYLREHVGPWSATTLEWIGPYWLGFASAFSLMLIVEIAIYWWRYNTNKVNVDGNNNPCVDNNDLSQGKVFHSGGVKIRRLGKRADNLELVAVARSNNRVYILSHWRPDGTESPRIRIDATHLDGSVDASFGHVASGFTSFSLSDVGMTQVSRMHVLADGGLLIIGSIFQELGQVSLGFLAKMDRYGSLDAEFGVCGLVMLERQGAINYGKDAVVVGKNIYCVAGSYQQGDIAVYCFNFCGVLLNYIIYTITTDGTAWPNRVVETTSDNGMFVVGKITSVDGVKSDGFILRIGSDGRPSKSFGSNGVTLLREVSSLSLVHQVNGVVVLPTGSALVSGTGNEGFIVGVDSEGRPLLSFGKSGTYESRATYRTTATSFSYSPKIDAVSLAGIESDGNSINRPFINLVDLCGRSLLQEDADPVNIEFDAHSFRSEHLLLESGNAFLAAQEGPLSLGRRGILISIVPLSSIDRQS